MNLSAMKHSVLLETRTLIINYMGLFIFAVLAYVIYDANKDYIKEELKKVKE